MCAEYERVQRVVQDDVWEAEKGSDGEPDETRMVKKFRRSAAGLEEQLPSDLRPPQVLKRTCDYLFDEVIGNASSLAQVHVFVWDRTRAIRNDFSIQQLTKLDELRIAVDCYERIARFHIMSLHQLASPDHTYATYHSQQEREQLDRTLLSLIQFYDDTRGRIDFPNEAEFRAYCVIFQLRSPTPDLEDNVQIWPRHIFKDRRVRRALDLYAAGCSTMGSQGPLNPKVSHLVARQDWQRFWILLASNETSYLMACIAEVYFNSIRQILLNALFRTFRANTTVPTPDWTLDVLCELFAFDNEEEVQTFCQYFGLAFKTREDGQTYLDLSSVAGRVLPQPSADMPSQLRSSLVEDKRHGRTLPAIINGLTVRQAQDAGFVVEEEHDEGIMDVGDGGEEDTASMDGAQGAEDDGDSLFIPETSKSNTAQPAGEQGLTNGLHSQPKPSPFSWGKPSDAANFAFSPQAPVAPSAGTASKPKFDFLGGGASTEGIEKPRSTGFNFLSAASKPAEKVPGSTSAFNFLQAGAKTSAAATESQPAFKWPVSTISATGSESISAPKFDFTSGASNALGAESRTPSDQPKGLDASATPTNGKAGASGQQNGNFSTPAPGSSGGHSVFNFQTPAAAKSASPEQATGMSPQLPTNLAPSSDVLKPATVESAPTSSDLPQNNPFLQATSKSPVQSSPEPTPSFPSQPKQVQPAQPHFTAPSSSTPPAISNTPPSPSNLNTNLRRPSTSTDTKPKKPSPLSHSFTAADDTASSAREPSATFAPPKESPAGIENPLTDAQAGKAAQIPKIQQGNPVSLTEVGHGPKQPVPFTRQRGPSGKPVEDFDATVTRIARELVNDPISGYLKQYVEYRASHIITSVQEEIAAEKMKLRLSELRISTLYRKYLKRWISLIWQKRMAKSGKDRRQRRRRRLEDGFDDGSSYGGGSMTDSRPGSVMGASSRKGHQEDVDAMFQRTMNSRSLAQPTLTDRQARAGIKRPTSSHGENGVAPRASAHKRLKSTSHVDDRGRVVKPVAPSQSGDDMLKRSSFLGFSVKGSSPPSRNTTKSNYFRLKAMGVHRADALTAPRGTKRSRTESTQSAAASPPQLRQLISAASSPEDASTRSLMPPPSSTLSRAQKAKEGDDALFARIRAARESLTMGTVYMQSEIEKDEERRRSLSASQSSNESPSMIKARSEARARASRAGSPEGDVPAYRLRESKFVPREHYGRAIEKAKEMRESRSRDNSRPTTRPVSRLEQSVEESPAKAFDLSFGTSAEHTVGANNSVPKGLPSFQSPAKAPITEDKAPSFSPFARPATFSFANHTTHMPDSNPFLQSTIPETADVSKLHPVLPFASASTNAAPQSTSGIKSASGALTGFGTNSTFGSQNSFAPQQRAAGFQSAFASQPTSNAGPFGSAFASSSGPTFGNEQVLSSFAPPQDQTVRPEMIDQSLEDSFGTQHEGVHEQVNDSQNYPVSPQESSYLHTQAVSLLSGSEDGDEFPAAQAYQPQVNGFGHDEGDEELLDECTEDEGYQPPYGNANPFSMLAGQDDGNRSQSQVTGDEMYDQDQFDDEEEGMGNGFRSQGEDSFSNDGDVAFSNRYYGGGDDEGANGDIDEDSDVSEGEDEAGEGWDSEEENEGDEDDEEGATAPRQHWPSVKYEDSRTVKPAPNPALQGMGQTEDAPIELDSD